MSLITPVRLALVGEAGGISMPIAGKAGGPLMTRVQLPLVAWLARSRWSLVTPMTPAATRSTVRFVKESLVASNKARLASNRTQWSLEQSTGRRR